MKTRKFIIIAGNCLIESANTLDKTAQVLKTLSMETGVDIVLKGSFDKANRTRGNSSRAKFEPLEALQILYDIGQKYNLMTLTDVHDEIMVGVASGFVDVLQIPAFLCRQTDILIAAAKTGKTVNIKKGQFMSPESMQWAVDKIRENGNEYVVVTERGTTFGYHDLVVDFRGVPVMKKFHTPVWVDITHSLQRPNQSRGVTKGSWEDAELMGRLAIAAGADGLYLETHPNPKKAQSDKDTQIPLYKLSEIIHRLIDFKNAYDQIY